MQVSRATEGICSYLGAVDASIHRAAERNCPKSLGRSCNVALRDTEMVLFGPFWPLYTGQIYGRSVAPTPFRTVSLGYSGNLQPHRTHETPSPISRSPRV